MTEHPLMELAGLPASLAAVSQREVVKDHKLSRPQGNRGRHLLDV
jgi:hypothetical protein